MMNEIIFLIDEDPTGGYTARALGASIFTEANSKEELIVNIREAVSSHFDDPMNAPKIVRLHFVRDEVFSL